MMRKDIAEKLGVDASNLSKILLGKRSVDLEKDTNLSKRFKLQITA
jgi:transcriptional regulator with XRE-family HTH domain